MTFRPFAALAAFITLILAPSLALACACGCSVFGVGAGSILPTDTGGTAWVEYDFMNQNHNWSGTKSAPAADNSDKQIRTDFYTVGGQYMFKCGWGVMVEVPVWNRRFRTDDGSGVQSFHTQSLGDVRLMGVYSGFSKDMSTGLILGLKLATGDFKADGFDRDTQVGTGSTDAIIGGYKVGSLAKDDSWTYFAKALWEVPFATQGGYKPGQTFDAAAGVSHHTMSLDDRRPRFTSSLQLILSERANDTGPASNPGDSGYNRLMISPGLEMDTAHWRLYGDVEVPIYQDVKGNQLVAPVLVKLVAGRSF